MRREEAEREAAARNRDDPAAARVEFYAFDESAGLSDEAWAVSTRLRPGGSTAPATYAGTRAQAAAPPPPPPPPSRAEETWPAPLAPAVPDDLEYEDEPEPHRSGRFMRWLGAAVIVMGMLWMAMLIVLAVILKPNDATGVGFYLGAAVLGLLAILLGVAIRRS